MPMRWLLFKPWRASRASCRRWSRPTPSLTPRRSPASSGAMRSSSSTSRAAETKTCIRWRSILGSRIAERFDGLRTARQTGLVTFVTAGDPDLATSAEILKALDRAGADVIEVGVPFSDPLADGPVIQRATERALAAGSNLRESLALVERIRPSVSAPLVMFSYANPILRTGVEAFAGRAAAAVG